MDTGASKTFINHKSLPNIQHYNFVKKQSSSFILADGFAPFYVLGTVDLSILFADQMTTIQAYVAQNLCTDIILGMDYITRYNLQIDTGTAHVGVASVHLARRRATMPLGGGGTPEVHVVGSD